MLGGGLRGCVDKIITIKSLAIHCGFESGLRSQILFCEEVIHMACGRLEVLPIV